MLPADEIQQVRDGLWIWQRFQPSVKVDCSSCAVRVGAGIVLIDPIPLAAEAMEELCSFGEIVGIVATSGNHDRAVADLRKRFGVTVFAHAAAEEGLGFPIDTPIAEGAKIFEELEVVEIAGAGSGEVALFDPRGWMIVGDALINLEPDGLALLPPKYCSDADEMRASLRKLLRFPIEVLTFAHGLPLVSQCASSRISARMKHRFFLLALLAAPALSHAQEKPAKTEKSKPVAAQAPVAPPAKPAVTSENDLPAQIAGIFFGLLQKNEVDPAYEGLMKGSRIAERPEELKTLKAKTREAIDVFGPVQSYELVETRNVGSHLLRRTYLSLNREFPLRWRFYFYLSNDLWRLIDLRVDDRVTEMFDEKEDPKATPAAK